MEVTFNEVRAHEIVNVYDGKRLGHAQDMVFNKETGQVLGLIVPGASKFLRKADDLFIPMSKIKKIGDDVILVSLAPTDSVEMLSQQNANRSASYIKYRRASVKLK